MKQHQGRDSSEVTAWEGTFHTQDNEAWPGYRPPPHLVEYRLHLSPLGLPRTHSLQEGDRMDVTERAGPVPGCCTAPLPPMNVPSESGTLEDPPPGTPQEEPQGTDLESTTLCTGHLPAGLHFPALLTHDPSQPKHRVRSGRGKRMTAMRDGFFSFLRKS